MDNAVVAQSVGGAPRCSLDRGNMRDREFKDFVTCTDLPCFYDLQKSLK
jgi:hypothetical protein